MRAGSVHARYGRWPSDGLQAGPAASTTGLRRIRMYERRGNVAAAATFGSHLE